MNTGASVPPPGVNWAGLATGAATSASLLALVDESPGELSGPELVDAVVASEKALSLLAGVQMRLLSALAAPFAAGDPMRLAGRLARNRCITGDDDPQQVQHFVGEAASCLAATEVAAALRISPVTAGIRVREAATMTTDLAPTLRALEDGRLDRGKVRVITEQCRPLTAANAAAVQDLVLDTAGTLSTSELRELTAQAVIVVDPAGAEERHEVAATGRDLKLRAQPDAMATLTGFLPADGAVKIFQISDLLAIGTAGAGDDTRGIGARRIDALVDIADQLLTHGHLDLSHFLSADNGDQLDRDASNGDDRDPGTDRIVDPATAGADGPGPATEDPAGADTGSAAAGSAAAGGDAGHGHTDLVASPGAAGVGVIDAEGGGRGAAEKPGPQESAGKAATGKPATGKPATGKKSSNRVLTKQGRRPHLSVTISLGTLAGLNQLPGVLAGFGAIPATLARAIATSAGTISTVITDPATGITTAAGDLTYRPRQHLRDKAAEFFSSCQFPSCRQPVWRCDLDHRERFDHDNPQAGGRTTTQNTGPLCQRHHLIKHHADWRMHLDTRNFVLHFTSPTGHSYTRTPQPPLTPELRVDSHPGGTAIAERLDMRALFAAASDEPTSPLLERLTSLLLRHHLNQPAREYFPDPDRWAIPDPTQADTSMPPADARGTTHPHDDDQDRVVQQRDNQRDEDPQGDDDDLQPPF